jgi:hypothetical protein
MSSARRYRAALAGAVTIVLGAAVGGGSAAASPPAGSVMAGRLEAQSLTVVAHVTSSTHKKLTLSLAASGQKGAGGSGFVVGLASGTESHGWNFTVPAGGFSLSSKDSGSLSMASAISPFGRVKLAISPTGRATTTKRCSASAHLTRRKVKVSGSFFFNTRSGGRHSWGTVGHKHRKVAFHGTAVSGYGQPYTVCTGSVSMPCAASVNWSASNSEGTVSLGGDSVGGTRGLVDADRVVHLSRLAGATRTDSVEASARRPVVNRRRHGAATLSARTSGHGAMGSARLVSSRAGSTSKPACGKHKREKSTVWTATYKTGKPALVLSEQIFGSFSIASDATATFSSTKP